MSTTTTIRLLCIPILLVSEALVAIAAAQEGPGLPPPPVPSAPADEDRLSKLASTREARRLAWSAALCGAEEKSAQGVEAVRWERAAARIAGVLNLYRVHVAQGLVMVGRAEARRARRELARLHAKPLPCSDDEVQAVRDCIESGGCYSVERNVIAHIALPEGLSE